jgi:hypothetical protein
MHDPASRFLPGTGAEAHIMLVVLSMISVPSCTTGEMENAGFPDHDMKTER